VSRNLSQVAEIGLTALDNLQKKRPMSADVRQRNIEFLQASSKPQAVLLLMVPPSVQLLVEAIKTQ
jgi:hexosaminidase